MFSQIPVRGVKCLPSNFLINKLLAELDNGHSAVASSCEKHDGEALTLFCQTCDKLICHCCMITDHRDHQKKSPKDIYPAEKEIVEKFVEESKESMLALEKSILALETHESRLQVNCKEVCCKVDTFINKQMEALEKKRKRLKDELQELAQVQKEYHESQRKSLLSYRNNMKRNVDVVEQALRKGNEIEVLAAKKQLLQISSVTSQLQPLGLISYELKIDEPLNDETVEKIANIEECDEEYTIEMRDNWSVGKHFRSFVDGEAKQFSIGRKISNTSFDPLPPNEVQVKIQRSGCSHVHSPLIAKNEDGSFSFSYCPPEEGEYGIEVVIKGRCLQGCPLEWDVEM